MLTHSMPLITESSGWQESHFCGCKGALTSSAEAQPPTTFPHLLSQLRIHPGAQLVIWCDSTDTEPQLINPTRGLLPYTQQELVVSAQPCWSWKKWEVQQRHKLILQGVSQGSKLTLPEPCVEPRCCLHHVFPSS